MAQFTVNPKRFEAGQRVLAYKVYRCWVSEYEILPDLDANANAITIRAHHA